jgi:FMN-dependent oxidoreductase (nitrilotriacetate monooxygenase family)
MPGSPRQMHLGTLVYATGHHVSGWRLPQAQAGMENLPLLVSIARTAERGKFDMLFFADAPLTGIDFHPSTLVRLEPLTLLSALAMVTERIGLAATATTTYIEPYNLARMFASLDHISNGRAAWNIVTGASPEAAANFGRTVHPPHGERYAMAAEFVDVVRGLWDSWDDGAITMDKASGTFADPAGMHVLDHHGKYYDVKGPLNLSRSPQGHPVLIQAGSSGPGRDLAAATADVVFTVQQEMAACAAFRDDVRQRAARLRRDGGKVAVMPGLCPVIGRTEREAHERFAELGQFLEPAAAMRVLSDRIGHDLSGYDLDAQLPELPDSTIMRGHAATLTALARREKLTLRQLRDITAASLGHPVVVGTAEKIADHMEQWFASEACDGFIVMPAWVPDQFEAFVSEVVPILQARGLFRQDYEGTTLRDHLGLPRPARGAATTAHSFTHTNGAMNDA